MRWVCMLLLAKAGHFQQKLIMQLPTIVNGYSILFMLPSILHRYILLYIKFVPRSYMQKGLPYGLTNYETIDFYLKMFICLSLLNSRCGMVILGCVKILLNLWC